MSAAPVLRLDEAEAASLLPPRDPRGHKGTFGRVSLVAGSRDYVGAALLAGTAALRAGSGLVTLCLPASLQPWLAGRVPELITRALPETAPYEVDAVAAAARVSEIPADALLLGPGLPVERPSLRLVLRLLALEGVPAVVDAGGLDALASLPRWWSQTRRALVVTPHPGEFPRLGRALGGSDDARHAAALEAAREWGVVVVLKGAHSVIASPDGRSAVAPFELPQLASGGTGDVLAGIVASLVGQGLAPFDAAALGVYLHARAGEAVGREVGDSGLLAGDLLAHIPRVRRSLAEARRA